VGGICAFPQNLPAGTTLTLAQVRTLADDILGHGCNTCGSVPITYPDNENVDDVGELTFNFVSEGKFVCTGTCISGENNDNAGSADTTSVSTQASTAVAITTATLTTAPASTSEQSTTGKSPFSCQFCL
jgi:hypothetical protein